MSTDKTSNLSDDFDADLARLERIRSGGGLTADCAFLLVFIDKLWAEYSRTLRRADETSGVPEEFTTSDAGLNDLLHLTVGIWRRDKGNHDTGMAWADALEDVLARLRPQQVDLKDKHGTPEEFAAGEPT